ncbi:MAG: hypothetical protein JZU63_00120, partial [Rhodoferax sp.]|nr:hypothetical protein [Rhodoferax sp.]
MPHVVEQAVDQYGPEAHVGVQAVQTEALEADAYTPAPQVGHVAVPTLEAKDPAAQPEHAAEVCIPVPVENIPVLQPVQVAEVCMPVPVEYEPETHF